MKQAILELLSGIYSLTLNVTNLESDINLSLPNTPPTAGQVLKASSGTPTNLEWGDVATGDGSVTSVGFTAPANEFEVTNSPITSAGDIALTWKDQPQFTVFAAPITGNGAPSFRALTPDYIPLLDASKINSGTIGIARLPVGTAAGTVAAGNDSRLHQQNTDTGTSSSFFHIDNDAEDGGVRLYNTGGVLWLRDGANSVYADLVVNNLVVRGTQEIHNEVELNVADAIIRLNAEFEGDTPTEDAGFEVERGTQTNAHFIWREVSQRFAGGLIGSEKELLFYVNKEITAADIVSGTYTWTHGLRRKPVMWAIWDNVGDGVLVQPRVVNDNTMTFNFNNVTVEGTWTLVAAG